VVKRTAWLFLCNCCDKQFWKLFTFVAIVLIKLLCCRYNSYLKTFIRLVV